MGGAGSVHFSDPKSFIVQCVLRLSLDKIHSESSNSFGTNFYLQLSCQRLSRTVLPREIPLYGSLYRLCSSSISKPYRKRQSALCQRREKDSTAVTSDGKTAASETKKM